MRYTDIARAEEPYWMQPRGALQWLGTCMAWGPSVTKKRKQQRTVPLPCVRREPDCMQISRAIATAQLDAWQKFVELCARDPAKADSFLSKFFNRSRQFEIALVDEEMQKTLGAFQTAEAIAADMSARANNKFPCDAEGRQVLADLVTRIRSAGAPPTGVPGVQQLPSSTTAQLPQLYSQDEFRDCLTKICASKKSVHAPLAATKAGSLVTDSLALQLCNLGKLVVLQLLFGALATFRPFVRQDLRWVLLSQTCAL